MITKITDDMVGRKITCKIKGVGIKDARIQKEGERYFICQDIFGGIECQDKLGYKFSWSVGDGSLNRILCESVMELQILPTRSIIERIPEVNEELVDIQGDRWVVLSIDENNNIFLHQMGEVWNAICGKIEAIDRMGFSHLVEVEIDEKAAANEEDGLHWSSISEARISALSSMIAELVRIILKSKNLSDNDFKKVGDAVHLLMIVSQRGGYSE